MPADAVAARASVRSGAPLWLDDLARPALTLYRRAKARAAARFVHVVTPQRAYPEVEVRAHGAAEEVATSELPSLPLAEECRHLQASVYRTPPRYSMLLPGVLYEPGQNWIATRRFEPIEQANQVPRRLHHYRWRPFLLQRDKIVKLSGTFTTLRSFRDNYFHTLADNVPALDSLRDPPYCDLDQIHLLLAPPLSSAEAFFLERALPANVVPRFLEPGRFYELERYVFSSFQTQRYSGYLPAAAVTALRERCAPARPPRRQRRIFVSRALARDGQRHVVNEAEVMALLGGQGFERVVLERLPPAEQIELFHDAACVVAAHGAGLANLLFARQADVVELFPEPRGWPHFYLLGRAGDHRYHYLLGDRPERNDRFRVDVAALRALLERIGIARPTSAAAHG
jgi:hypothetical protein